MQEIKKMILSVYRKWTLKGIKNPNKEEPNVKEWKKFLSNLPETNGDIYVESYNKYRCRMYYFGIAYKIAINLAAILSLIVALIRRLFVKAEIKIDKKQSKSGHDEKKMLIIKDDSVALEDVFPVVLCDEFSTYITMKKIYPSPVLQKEAKSIYKNVLKKHFFSLHYRYLVLRELGLHSVAIEKTDPDATVVYVNERNVASPLIRELYEKQGKEFISFMHGEYLLQLIQGYMSFSRFYIWDGHYIIMFEEDLNCNIGEYIIYTPKKLSKKFPELSQYSKDLTYYLSGESDASVRMIAQIAQELEKQNIRLVVRPHPRISNMRLIESLFPDKNIEKSDVDIDDSIIQSKYIVGISTTILSETYYGGKEVLIDDVTNIPYYNNLYDRKYVMLNKNLTRLSDYLKERNIEIT